MNPYKYKTAESELRTSISEEEAIKEYIANQLKADQETDQLSLFDPKDPFTGSK